MHEAMKPTCGFHAAANNPQMRKMLKGMTVFIQWVAELMENILTVKTAETKLQQENQRKCPRLVPNEYDVIIERIQCHGPTTQIQENTGLRFKICWSTWLRKYTQIPKP